ncbi:pleckstrin homology domain-containing family G member 5-like isoform X3 [Tachypleus tridentatus]|uniref:pleckstrin homology domain-containing family G member 5-like isoform X3 n=1 Tax=Tachypleus tridentatus TaxID=6853 RepID=UPI003FD265B3
MKNKKYKQLLITQRSKSLTQIDCPEKSKITTTELNMNNNSKMTAKLDNFTVSSEMLDEPTIETIPAISGVCLREVVKDLLAKRGLELDAQNVSAFLDSSNTPLPADGDCFLFGGKHLRIRAKGKVHATVIAQEGGIKSVYGGTRCGGCNRQDKPRMFCEIKNGGRKTDDMSDTSQARLTTTTLESSFKPSRGRSTHSKKSGIFFNTSKTEKIVTDFLMELLDQCDIVQQGLLTFELSQKDIYKLEHSWKDVVVGVQDLSERMKAQQNAIWELIETEIFFIKRLRIIIELYLTSLRILQSIGILNEVDIDKVFSNIQDVYTSNHKLWINHILPMLNASRTTKRPLNPVLMKDGFLQCVNLFQPYTQYCTELSFRVEYVKKRHQENEFFKAYVAWCETKKECDRLQLSDLLIKPMQRLTKYPLLLNAILKKTDNKEQVCALVEMKRSIEMFVLSVDTIMLRQNEKKRLDSICDRIESYDVIDNNNEELEKAMREHGSLHLDLTCPMPACDSQQTRQLIKEGAAIKLRDSSANKVEVYCFLFTDMFLVCKPVGRRGDKVRIIRQPYLIEKLIVQELSDGGGFMVVYLNEFRVAVAAFILYTHDPRNWLENIKKAQQAYQEAKRNSKQTSSFIPPKYVEDPAHLSFGPTSAASGEGRFVSSIPNHNKAIGFELGNLRRPVSTNSKKHDKPRARGFGTRSGLVSMTATSPSTNNKVIIHNGGESNVGKSSTRQEELLRAFGSSHNSNIRYNKITPKSLVSDNLPTTTLSPSSEATVKQERHSETGIPSSVSVRTSRDQIHKPPLIKTRNVSSQVCLGPVMTTKSANIGSGTVDFALNEAIAGGRNAKGIVGQYRRYRTTNFAELRKKGKELEDDIRKRFSWNECNRNNEMIADIEGKLVRQTNVYHSSDSIYSSSGVESNTSSSFSVEEYENTMESYGPRKLSPSEPRSVESHQPHFTLKGCLSGQEL